MSLILKVTESSSGSNEINESDFETRTTDSFLFGQSVASYTRRKTLLHQLQMQKTGDPGKGSSAEGLDGTQI
jgi:hypothetical protein